MIPAAEDCDECVPEYLKPTFGPKAALSTLVFAATFVLVTSVAQRRIYPLLSTAIEANVSSKGSATFERSHTDSTLEPTSQGIARRIAAITFSATIALSAVLTELLLCEISNSFNPTARSLALQVTVAGLLGLLIIAIPLLGIYSVVKRSGYKFTGEGRGRLRLAWVLEFAGYATFLLGFWTIGTLLPEKQSDNEPLITSNLFQECLDRLGVTGVALMALLSGFASISAIWQCFGPKVRTVSETDIARKQAGLDATLDMLGEKREKMEFLQRKLSGPSTQSFWTRTVGSIRGNPNLQERQILELEINGLETMASSLESSLSILRSRRHDQRRARTTIGRLSVVFSYSFACYCMYRIVTTAVNILRRVAFSSSSVGGRPTSPAATDSDPITYFIAFFARHVYPSLDQASWAQQISFLLSGAMLFASFSAVTQTFHLFARFMPSVLHATRTNFALLISQVSGMYVISSALMLRGMMPREVSGVINSALGAGLLEPQWVQKWFDGFYMSSVLVTALGVFLSRQIGGVGVFDDDYWDNDIEMGKRTR